MTALETLAKSLGMPLAARPGLALRPARGNVRRWQRTGPRPDDARTGLLFSPEPDTVVGVAQPPPVAAVAAVSAVPAPRTPHPAPPPSRAVIRPKALAENLRLRVTEEGWIPAARLKLDTPSDCAELFRWLTTADREKGYVVNCDSEGHVMSICLAGVGSLDYAMLHPREIFKTAVLTGAAVVWLAHNHPSGDPSPSTDDIRWSERMRHIGEALGVRFGGSVVVGEEGWSDVSERVRERWDGAQDIPAGIVPELAVTRKPANAERQNAVTGSDHIAAFIRPYFVTNPQQVLAVYYDTKLRPIAIENMGATMHEDTARRIMAGAYGINAARIAVVTDIGNYENALREVNHFSRMIGPSGEPRMGGMLLDVIGIAQGGEAYSSAADQRALKSLAAILDAGTEPLAKAIPVIETTPEPDKTRSHGAGASERSGSPQKQDRLASPPTPPHSRRARELLLYWIEKTGTRNVRLQDVLYYATDAEIGQLVNHLRDQHTRATALDQFVAAAKGEVGGELLIEDAGDGNYLVRPAMPDAGGESPSADAPDPEPAAPAEPPEDPRSFAQKLADGVRNLLRRRSNA